MEDDDPAAELPDAIGPEFVCKHCDAVGEECPACEGLGTTPDFDDPAGLDGLSLEDECPTCEGWGVIEVARPAPKAKGRKRKGGGA